MFQNLVCVIPKTDQTSQHIWGTLKSYKINNLWRYARIVVQDDIKVQRGFSRVNQIMRKGSLLVNAFVAQLVEHVFRKDGVVGSIPIEGSIFSCHETH